VQKRQRGRARRARTSREGRQPDHRNGEHGRDDPRAVVGLLWGRGRSGRAQAGSMRWRPDRCRRAPGGVAAGAVSTGGRRPVGLPRDVREPEDCCERSRSRGARRLGREGLRGGCGRGHRLAEDERRQPVHASRYRAGPHGARDCSGVAQLGAKRGGCDLRVERLRASHQPWKALFGPPVIVFSEVRQTRWCQEDVVEGGAPSGGGADRLSRGAHEVGGC
jgi:hypothetical protein